MAPTYAVCFDPATATIAGIKVATLAKAATVAGAAISAVGAVQQGRAANTQAKFQSEVLQQQAQRDREKAAADETAFRRNQSRVLASRRAALGASGVDQATGSPLLVSEDFASEVELQARRIRSGGELQATRAEQQAGLQRFAGKAAQRGGFVRGGSLLISGAGKAF